MKTIVIQMPFPEFVSKKDKQKHLEEYNSYDKQKLRENKLKRILNLPIEERDYIVEESNDEYIHFSKNDTKDNLFGLIIKIGNISFLKAREYMYELLQH